MAGLDELPQLYRELRLLRLKYEHLADVCRSLMRKWPNRSSDGRLVKAVPTKTTAKGQELITEQVAPTVEPPQQSEPSELQLLEGILSKAQKIRISEEEQEQRKISGKKKASVAAESCRMAANVYQPSKQQRDKPGSGNPPPKHKRAVTKTSVRTTKVRQPSVPKTAPRSKVTTSAKSERKKSSHLPGRSGSGTVSVRVERHTSQGETSQGHVKSVSVSHSESVEAVVMSQPGGDVCGGQETGHQEDGRSYSIMQDGNGSKLRMPSRYYTLQNSLAKIRDYIVSQQGDPTTEAVRTHFIQRLLPKEEVPVRAIQLQLAREEYQLLTEELEAISPQEWAVSEKSQREDVLRLKVKLDQLLDRARALKEELKSEEEAAGVGVAHRTDVGVAHRANVGVAHAPGVGVACGAALPEGPLAYSSLDQWLRLVELEHALHMQRLEKTILELCVGAFLPQLRERGERISTQCLRMLSELAGQPKPIFICNQPT